jgi:hypothetical protein
MATKAKFLPTTTVLAAQLAPAPAADPGSAVHGTLPKRAGSIALGPRGAVLTSLAAVGAVALALLAFSWYVVWAAPPPDRITPDAYERVKEGMSRDEAQAAVGLPAGDYRDGAHRPGGRWDTEWSEEAGDEDYGGDTVGRLAWEGNVYSVVVGLDEAGAVRWKTLWRHVPPTPRGPVEKALAWLGR